MRHVASKLSRGIYSQNMLPTNVLKTVPSNIKQIHFTLLSTANRNTTEYIQINCHKCISIEVYYLTFIDWWWQLLSIMRQQGIVTSLPRLIQAHIDRILIRDYCAIKWLLDTCATCLAQMLVEDARNFRTVAESFYKVYLLLREFKQLACVWKVNSSFCVAEGDTGLMRGKLIAQYCREHILPIPHPADIYRKSWSICAVGRRVTGFCLQKKSVLLLEFANYFDE